MVGRQLSPVSRMRLMKGRTSEMGMARPSPSIMVPSVSPVILATVMPTTCPLSLTSAPPELPEFRAAEVWMRVMVLPSTVTSRAREEMMLSVMVP